MSNTEYKHSLCSAVGEGHLRLLCTKNNEYLIKWVKMKSKQKCFWNNKGIKTAMKIFCEDCDLNVLEICKNDLDVLTKFYYLVFESEIAKIQKEQFKGKLKANLDPDDDESKKDFIKMMSNVMGVGIAVYDYRNQLLAYYNPNQYIYKLDCIKIKEFHRAYKYIETEPLEQLNISIKYTNCEYCMYEHATQQSCSHYYHASCISLMNPCKCLICKSSLNQLSFVGYRSSERIHTKLKCSCGYCFNCLILKLNELPNSFDCVCSKKISLNKSHPILLTSFQCEKCKYSYHASDFLLFLCPDNHNYLCKSCWVNAIIQKSEEDPLLCPLSGADLTQNQIEIMKPLTSMCTYCSYINIEFHSTLSCQNKCKVCYSCQLSLIKKSSTNPACINCNKVLKKNLH